MELVELDVSVEEEAVGALPSVSDAIEVEGVVVGHEELVGPWGCAKDLGP